MKLERIFIMNNIAHFNQNFLRLREDYTSLKKKLAIKDKKEASRYNIFSILNIHEFEVKTHTPFLKNLLEVDGTHGQGDLFLSSFIQRFIPHEKKQYFILDKEDDYRIEEEFFTGQNGRLDIYIHSHDPQKKFGIVVENKIYADDQPEQIKKYYEFLKTQQFADIEKQMMLFYLTIDGKEPSTESLPVAQKQELIRKNILQTISYKRDIKTWLKSCIPDVQAAKVQYLLEAYLETIRDLKQY